MTFVKTIIKTLKCFTMLFIIYMPNPLGYKIRYWYYSGKFKRIGKNVKIDEGVIIEGAEWISIGDNVWIDKYCVLTAGKLNLEGAILKEKANKNFIWEEGELIIGSNVHISAFCIIQSHGGFYIGDNGGFASGVKAYSLSNLATNPNDLEQIVGTNAQFNNPSFLKSPIVLNKNVGVALNCIIMPGVTMGENSFATPNSVLLGNIKPNYFVSGNPAKKVKERFKINNDNK